MNAQVDVLAAMDWSVSTLRKDGYPNSAGVLRHARDTVAALIAERDALWEEVERLRRDCGEAYQVVGAGMLGEPCSYTQADVGRALDNLSAAANGEPRPHDDLLPWPSAFVIRRPTGESA